TQVRLAQNQISSASVADLDTADDGRSLCAHEGCLPRIVGNRGETILKHFDDGSGIGNYLARTIDAIAECSGDVISVARLDYGVRGSSRKPNRHTIGGSIVVVKYGDTVRQWITGVKSPAEDVEEAIT